MPPWLLHYVLKKVRWEPEVATFKIKVLNFSRVIHSNWLAKINLGGPLVVNIVSYCCTRKMLKETETHETIDFFDTFSLLVAFQFGGSPDPPLATPMPRGAGPE